MRKVYIIQAADTIGNDSKIHIESVYEHLNDAKEALDKLAYKLFDKENDGFEVRLAWYEGRATIGLCFAYKKSHTISYTLIEKELL